MCPLFDFDQLSAIVHCLFGIAVAKFVAIKAET